MRCHPRKNRGVDSMGSDATLQNVEEIRARLQNGKVHKPNDAISEMTGREPTSSDVITALVGLIKLFLHYVFWRINESE